MAMNNLLAQNPFAPLANLPGMRPVLVLAGLAMSVAIGVTAAFWMREPGYTQLYGSMSGKEASEMVNTLTASGIPYRLNEATGAILVPSEKVHEARLKLAEQGLPRSSGFGLEIIGGEQGLATSQFMEGARYHHALETELARSIASLQPVQSARVHLAVPKSTVFLGKKQKPSASVLVQLYPGRSLAENQVAAVVNLVASSIPELDASQVTVVDQQGRLLNSPGDNSDLGLSVRQLDYVARVEQAYMERVEAILSPLVGPGRVRATVTADVDFTQREETAESYAPETVVRSEQVAEDRRTGDALTGGIPGALSNQPPPSVTQSVEGAVPAEAAAAAQMATTTTPANESIRRTRNFEVDRTLSHTRQSIGTLRRLSVAVLVDERRITDEEGNVTTVKLSEAELEEMTRLVKDAVGFSEARGDSVTLSNVAFYQGPPEEPLEGPGFLASPTVQGLGKQLLAAGLILAVVMVLVRPLLRALGGDGPAATPALAAGAGGTAVLEARDPLNFDDKLSVARQLADSNPERVAQIVRAWVQSDEGAGR
jgi:flagellar M-ring protein FliF